VVDFTALTYMKYLDIVNEHEINDGNVLKMVNNLQFLFTPFELVQNMETFPVPTVEACVVIVGVST
jgi:hypothetical protein